MIHRRMRLRNCGTRSEARESAYAFSTDFRMGNARLKKMPSAERRYFFLTRNVEHDDFESYLATLFTDGAKEIMRCAGGDSMKVFHSHSSLGYLSAVTVQTSTVRDVNHSPPARMDRPLIEFVTPLARAWRDTSQTQSDQPPGSPDKKLFDNALHH
jgi:hypothetical protein